MKKSFLFFLALAAATAFTSCADTSSPHDMGSPVISLDRPGDVTGNQSPMTYGGSNATYDHFSR